MSHGDFVWCDLSTLNPQNARGFYCAVLGWRLDEMNAPDGSPYILASSGSNALAGLLEMSARFQDMDLPSFWMPYIEVEGIDAVTAQATDLGGTVELGPMEYGPDTRIALIRDPLGAGFTVIEGPALTKRGTAGPKGAPIWHGLYVSDAKAVIPFYEAIFGWHIKRNLSVQKTYQIRAPEGEAIAELLALPERKRGKAQFWAVHFAVPTLGKARKAIKAEGGKVLYEDREGAPPLLLATDPDGAAFFAREHAVGLTAITNKWKTLLGLFAIVLAVLFDWGWAWGVLFLAWTITGIKSRETFFVERITRADNPGLYWTLIASWILLSLLLIGSDLVFPSG